MLEPEESTLDTVVRNAAISSCSKGGQKTRRYKKFESSNIEQKALTAFTSFHFFLSLAVLPKSEGHWWQALELLWKSCKDRIEADVITFSSVALLYCKTGFRLRRTQKKFGRAIAPLLVLLIVLLGLCPKVDNRNAHFVSLKAFKCDRVHDTI